MADEGLKQKLAAILSADVKGYSRLLSQDRVSTIKTLKDHREMFSGFVQQYGGRVVDTPGDNILVVIDSVSDAVNCAVEIQRELAERNAEVPSARMMQWRIGVNLGDVVEEESKVYGDGINIAARVEKLAEPGGICISGSVYEQVHGKLGLEYESLGEQTVKNITNPIRIYRVLFYPGAVAKQETEPAKGTASSLSEKPSIAVLPFDNMSDDPKQEYFVDGMVDEVITRLSMNSRLLVISRKSTFTYKDKRVRVSDVGKDLQARYVLQGGIRLAGDRIRVTVQFIDASTEDHVWAKTYDRELVNIFAIQDEIAMQVVSSLNVELTQAEIERVKRNRTSNLTANDLYWRGLEQLRLHTGESRAKCRDYALKAIELDPEFADAYSLIGRSYWFDSAFGQNRDPDIVDRIASLATKAITLDSKAPEGHRMLSRAYLEKGEYAMAIEKAESALEINPNDIDTYWDLCMAYAYSGKPAEALEVLDKAARLNPKYPDEGSQFYGVCYNLMGRYEEAIAALQRDITRNPWNSYTYCELAVSYLGRWIAQQDHDARNLDLALQAAEKSVSINETYWGLLGLRNVHIWRKEYTEAIAQTERAVGLYPHLGFYKAGILNALGKHVKAAEIAETALRSDRSNLGAAVMCLSELSTAYHRMDRYEEALKMLARLLEHDLPFSLIYDAHMQLAVLYSSMNRQEEAKAEADELLKLLPHFSVDVWGERNPMKDRDQVERDMAALRKTGLK